MFGSLQVAILDSYEADLRVDYVQDARSETLQTVVMVHGRVSSGLLGANKARQDDQGGPVEGETGTPRRLWGGIGRGDWRGVLAVQRVLRAAHKTAAKRWPLASCQAARVQRPGCWAGRDLSSIERCVPTCRPAPDVYQI